MTRHDTRGLPRPDPELDTPSYQVLESSLLKVRRPLPVPKFNLLPTAKTETRPRTYDRSQCANNLREF